MAELLRPSVRSLLQGKEEVRAELRRRLEDPAVLANGRAQAELRRQQAQLDRILAPFEELLGLERQLEEAQELARESDPELRALAQGEVGALERRLQAQVQVLLVRLVENEEDGEDRSVIMEIRAGTGGEEASLFARDLFRMYGRLAEAQGWRLELLDASTTELGGFREVVFSVTGAGAWSHLRYESGGHRVQRVPETEAQGRIHTSAATVAVLPEPEELEVEIQPRDLKVDTMRASGPGGQHVNKTSSAVRITHLPTGLVVVCQDEKSQHKNRAKAMRVLRSRIFDLERQARESKRAAERRSQIGSGDRNERIRTYNFPQNRMTDHRLKENFTLDQILEGKMIPLLERLVQLDREERIQAL